MSFLCRQRSNVYYNQNIVYFLKKKTLYLVPVVNFLQNIHFSATEMKTTVSSHVCF